MCTYLCELSNDLPSPRAPKGSKVREESAKNQCLWSHGSFGLFH